MTIEQKIEQLIGEWQLTAKAELNFEQFELLKKSLNTLRKKALRQGYEKAVRVREIRDKIRNGK
ncbi:MAG: hypothetical protein PHS34_09590 [Candidatus Omnitrophica bacterium]|nr:hypothetical protein [Candidatus Omnitrophota bacterium]